MGSRQDTEHDLQELADPEFFSHWADVRNRLALTSPGSTEHAEIKRRYDAVAAEYRRRIDGAMAR
jgi:hypothetical protein